MYQIRKIQRRITSTQCQEVTVFRRSHVRRSPGLIHRVSMSMYKLMTKKKGISFFLFFYFWNQKYIDSFNLLY